MNGWYIGPASHVGVPKRQSLFMSHTEQAGLKQQDLHLIMGSTKSDYRQVYLKANV